MSLSNRPSVRQPRFPVFAIWYHIRSGIAKQNPTYADTIYYAKIINIIITDKTLLKKRTKWLYIIHFSYTNFKKILYNVNFAKIFGTELAFCLFLLHFYNKKSLNMKIYITKFTLVFFIAITTVISAHATTVWHGLYLGSSAKGTTSVTSFTAK